ncbi:MAG: hypothetical protein H7175_26840 [Burkholderiales bacterium]|nr:hypothetical protein [Anaerolineae bacterium]
MYVLDDRNDLVYRITLTDDGLNMVPNSRQVIPTMRRGGAVNEYVMGDLIDIAWATDGSGLSQGNVLVALDAEGVLVEYSPTFLARGAQRLLGTENWVSPIAMTFWEGRLYVLDPGAGGRGQIWRYEPSGGSYSAAPVEYFTGQTRPNITNAVDFGIDDRGDVYLLLSNGVVAKYRGGEPLNFGYTAFPDGQVFDSAQAMFLNNDPVAPGIYMVSRDTRTIFETSLAGTFFNSYRAYDEDLFASLTGVVADTGQGVIYALSGNSVLAFARTQ